MGDRMCARGGEGYEDVQYEGERPASTTGSVSCVPENLCSDIYRMDSNPSNPILEKILPSTANNAITYPSQFLYDETRLFGQLATPQCT